MRVDPGLHVALRRARSVCGACDSHRRVCLPLVWGVVAGATPQAAYLRPIGVLRGEDAPVELTVQRVVVAMCVAALVESADLAEMLVAARAGSAIGAAIQARSAPPPRPAPVAARRVSRSARAVVAGWLLLRPDCV